MESYEQSNLGHSQPYDVPYISNVSVATISELFAYTTYFSASDDEADLASYVRSYIAYGDMESYDKSNLEYAHSYDQAHISDVSSATCTVQQFAYPSDTITSNDEANFKSNSRTYCRFGLLESYKQPNMGHAHSNEWSYISNEETTNSKANHICNANSY